MKLFRWSGLLGLLVLLLLLAIIGYFFIDRWVKLGIESAGFAVNKAEVNVGSVRLALSPLGFRLRDVQIADANQPERNALVAEQITLDMSLAQLFFGDVRIHDLTVTGLQTDVPRQRIARVKEQPAVQQARPATAPVAQQTASALDVAGIALPDPQQAVSDQLKHAEAAVSNAQRALTAARESITAAAAELPSSDDLASYQARIAEVKSLPLDSLAGITDAQSRVSSLLHDIAQDQAAVAEVKHSVSRAVQDGQQAVAQISEAPAADWQALAARYPFNKDGAIELGRLLLGERFIARLEQAQHWYEIARPWLAHLRAEQAPQDEPPARLSGEFIRFPQSDPSAVFQLDHGELSFVADDWPWQLTVENLSTPIDHHIKPMQLRLQRGSDERTALQVSAVLNQHQGQLQDSFAFTGRGVAFAQQQVKLADAQLMWQPQAADVSGNLLVTAGQLDGRIQLLFPDNDMQVTGDGQFSRYLGQALATINEFQLTVHIAGTIKEPQLQLMSDLDNQLTSVLQASGRAQYDAWLADARAQLNAQVDKLRAPADSALDRLTLQQGDVQRRIDQFETEVVQRVQALQSQLDSQRTALQDKAQAKLDAAEEAAKKAAQEKAKEGLQNLRDKINF